MVEINVAQITQKICATFISWLPNESFQNMIINLIASFT